MGRLQLCQSDTKVSDYFQEAGAAISEIITKVSDHFQGASAAISEIITKVSDYFQGAGAAISEITTNVSDHFQGAVAATAKEVDLKNVQFKASWKGATTKTLLNVPYHYKITKNQHLRKIHTHVFFAMTSFMTSL